MQEPAPADHRVMSDEQDFLQVADAAAEARVTPAAIWSAVRAGRLRVAARTRRGMLLFLAADIADYLARTRGAARAAQHSRAGFVRKLR